MSELRCVIRDKDGNQCPTVIEVSEPVAEKVSFMCRLHTDSVMRKAVGNTKLPRPTTPFQESQHDPKLRWGRMPIGSEHIKNQGSNVLTPDKIHVVDRPGRHRE